MIDIYKPQKRVSLVHIVLVGAVLGASIYLGDIIHQRMDACSPYENVTLINRAVNTDIGLIDLEDIPDKKVTSYRLPLFMDEGNQTLYDLLSCP